MTDSEIRRIVTGHDAAGNSVILEDGPSPQFSNASNERVTFHELWNTQETPAAIHATEPKEPNDRPLRLPPDPGGTIIRICDVHAGNYRTMGTRADGKNAAMHRTKTIDYAVVLSGEIVALVGEQETLMTAGDVLIQRGTDHAWHNRSQQTCRILFVLVDGEFSDALKASLPELDLMVAPPSLGEGDR